MSVPDSRQAAVELDRGDPLAAMRDLFALPGELIYLDGNSLGPLPHATVGAVHRTLREEWGESLIGSWNEHGWIDLPHRLGDLLAPVIGAGPGQVVVADSTSVNLYKLLWAALELRPDRASVITEEGNFPTDCYLATAAARAHGRALEVVPRHELEARLDDRVAALVLTHVDFRSGEMHDMAALTARAHDAGALVIWDLAHSAGAVPLALDRWGVDMAVGCTYKYLNGGPGAPAFAYVAQRHHHHLSTPLPGWMGHANPFAMAPAYEPAAGVARLLCGTPPILSLAAVEPGLATVSSAGVERLRAKSVALSELLIGLVERRCTGLGLDLASPRDSARRGSQVSFRHPHAYAVCQALIAAGVVGDFREPDILRLGLAPLYLRFVDIWDAVERLREILTERTWDDPRFTVRARVT